MTSPTRPSPTRPSPTRPVQHARVDNAARYSHTARGAAVGETFNWTLYAGCVSCPACLSLVPALRAAGKLYP